MKYLEGKSLEAECRLVTSRSWRGKREAEMGSIVKWIWELKNIPQHSDLKKKYNLSKYNENEIPLLLGGENLLCT